MQSLKLVRGRNGTQEDPFVMPRQSSGLAAGGGADALRSHEPYEGFCIDLLELLARALHFNYTIHYVLAVRTSRYTRLGGTALNFTHMSKLRVPVLAPAVRHLRQRHAELEWPRGRPPQRCTHANTVSEFAHSI